MEQEQSSSATPTEYDRRADPPWVQQISRFAAVVLLLFVLSQVGVLALARVSPDAFNQAVAIYQHPAGVVGSVVLLGLLLFYALNGLRIVAIELTEWGARRGHELLSFVVVIWFALMAPSSYVLLRYPIQQLWGDA